jgi:2-succinyl-5-enolpyruvyl-6-hydroxy-3-cyclohexene-1-carboxylate synthase
VNIESAKQILLQLFKQGVKTLCLCPGARNAPFIALLEKNKNFEVLSFFDERSAGFFALGRSRRDGQPVAVLTTSGTAVSELLSPVIEAHYTHTPLVVLSSDRPKRLRGTGAPQAIEQAQIFFRFC